MRESKWEAEGDKIHDGERVNLNAPSRLFAGGDRAPRRTHTHTHTHTYTHRGCMDTFMRRRRAVATNAHKHLSAPD